MATTVTRANAEILRLFKLQWNGLEVDAILVNTTGASPQPTAASSVATWMTYAVMDINNPSMNYGYPYVTINSSAWTYNSTTGRAESASIAFNFNQTIAQDFSLFTTSTVTHIVVCDAYGLVLPTTAPPCFVLAESPSLTLTSTSTLSRTVKLFGREAV